MKVVIFTCLYGRLSLTKKFFENLSLDVYCAVSTDEDESIAKEYAKDYTRVKNKPLSYKFNHSIELLRDVDFDYAVILGSDNFISDNFVSEVLKVAESDYIAFKDIWFYSVENDKTTYMSYDSINIAPIGAGSFFSKKLLEEMDYKLWSEPINRALDTHRHRRLNKYKCQYLSCKELGVEMVDVKLAMNITNPNIVNGFKKDELKLIDVNIFKGLTSNEPKHINKKISKLKKDKMKVQIEVIKDHKAGLKKGEKRSCDIRNARLLEANGYVKILDDNKKAEPKAKAPNKKAPAKKAPAKKKPCGKCDDDKPCKGCQESAVTTNIPKRNK